MLFKRYNDVSFLLSSMCLSEVYDFIKTMIEETQEDKLWYVWNHLAFREEEFEEFKKRIKEESKPVAVKKTIAKEQEQVGIDVANKILGWEGDDGTI